MSLGKFRESLDHALKKRKLLAFLLSKQKKVPLAARAARVNIYGRGGFIR